MHFFNEKNVCKKKKMVRYIGGLTKNTFCDGGKRMWIIDLSSTDFLNDERWLRERNDENFHVRNFSMVFDIYFSDFKLKTKKNSFDGYKVINPFFFPTNYISEWKEQKINEIMFFRTCKALFIFKNFQNISRSIRRITFCCNFKFHNF